MFEKFLSGNIDRFRQRYEGTYGFYRAPGRGRLLVKLAEIDATRCSFVDAQNISYHVAPDHPQEVGFEFLPPDSKWYNIASGAVFAQRLASRQWQRGVTSKTLELGLLKRHLLYPIRVDFANLSQIYEHPINPADAIKSLEEGRSWALSGQFALDTGVIFVLKEPIGSYELNGKKFTMKLNEPDLWRTEITDALTAIGHTATIQ